MHDPRTLSQTLRNGVCEAHQDDPGACGAQRDAALYFAAGALVVAGIAVGAWFATRRD